MTSLERTERSILKSSPVPGALAELGIRMGLDEASGMRVVVIPPEVREHVNVLDPVSSFAQADPNWTPSVRVVALDPRPKDGAHFYEQVGRKLAPTKQGLELLAKAAGILYTRTARIARNELAIDEALGIRATLGIRRSDGSVEEITREKTWVEEAERAEIEEAVDRATTWENGKNTGKPRFTGPERETEIRKRWLAELKNRAAKTESKAVLRAIRAALQIPHTFAPADAAKPFVVIGYSFTPDYDDVETKRLLIAAGLNAQQAFYGGTRVSGDVEVEPNGYREIEASEPRDEETADLPPAAPDAQQAGEAVPDPPSASPAPEPEPEPEQSQFSIPASALTPEKIAADQAAILEIPVGKLKGKPVAEADEGWLRWACRNLDRGKPLSEAVWAYVRVYHPDIYQQVSAEQETGS